MQRSQGPRALRRLVSSGRSGLPTRGAPLVTACQESFLVPAWQTCGRQWRGFAQQASTETAGKSEVPPWMQGDDDDERPKARKETAAEKPAAEEEEAPELTPVERLAAELEEVQEKSRAKKKELLLALADFENNKKKFMKERETRSRYAKVNFGKRMVEVYTEFEDLPALKPVESELKEGSPTLSLQEGVSLTRDLFAAAMDRSDVEKLFVEPGTPVVNARHQVVGSTAGDGSLPKNSIAEVVEEGWMMDLRSKAPQVLRKATVKTVE